MGSYAIRVRNFYVNIKCQSDVPKQRHKNVVQRLLHYLFGYPFKNKENVFDKTSLTSRYFFSNRGYVSVAQETSGLWLFDTGILIIVKQLLRRYTCFWSEAIKGKRITFLEQS